jgi:hypothetical protein
MRRISLVPVILAVTLGSAMAAGPRVLSVDAGSNAPRPVTEADFEKYHGFMFDLSDFADRTDFGAISGNLRKQLDVVENVRLSPRVIDFFHSVPIVASEMDCLDQGAGAACYGPLAPTRRNRTSLGITTWDQAKHEWTNPDLLALAADSGRGVIMLRPNLMQYADDPVLLHEFMHAYHARLLPNGYDNKGVIGFYAEAKGKELFGKNVYAAVNHKEFFAVTASIFLSGKDSTHEPNTRATLKEKMPGYYKYLVGLFGFDPDPTLPDAPASPAAPATPVASVAPAAPATPVASAAPAASPASTAAPAPKVN